MSGPKLEVYVVKPARGGTQFGETGFLPVAAFMGSLVTASVGTNVLLKGEPVAPSPWRCIYGCMYA